MQVLARERMGLARVPKPKKQKELRLEPLTAKMQQIHNRIIKQVPAVRRTLRLRVQIMADQI